MSHDVFISHSSNDRMVATAVCARLEEAGIRCWIAPRDITPGTSWGGSIVKAISEARIMILIFSGEANRSPQILREVERAVGRHVVILPFRLENVAPAGDLEYFISAQHWLDALTPPLEQHIDYLVAVVQRVLTETPDMRGKEGVDQSGSGSRGYDAESEPQGPRHSEPTPVTWPVADPPAPETPRRVSSPPPAPERSGPVDESFSFTPRRTRWMVGGGAVLLIAVLVWGFRGGSSGGVDPARAATELERVEQDRLAAEQRKHDTDARAYVVADSLLEAARLRLAGLRAGGVPATLSDRMNTLDSALTADRAATRRACEGERQLGLQVECPREQGTQQ